MMKAIAPTASISIISGTTSSIDSYFSNLYSRNMLSGKHIVINLQLIEGLEEKGYWSDERADTIKANNGSVQPIKELEGRDLTKSSTKRPTRSTRRCPSRSISTNGFAMIWKRSTSTLGRKS